MRDAKERASQEAWRNKQASRSFKWLVQIGDGFCAGDDKTIVNLQLSAVKTISLNTVCLKERATPFAGINWHRCTDVQGAMLLYVS